MSWVQILSASLTPVIAVIGVYIAYQQWHVNRANLKERLFERRMEVFLETQTYLTEILREAKISDSSIWGFNPTHQKARFLFGKDMQDYLIKIRARSIKMRQFEEEFKPLPVGEERSILVSKNSDELMWLTKQLDVIFDKFDPYLSFSKH